MKINFSSLFLLLIIKLCLILSYNTNINQYSFIEELNKDNKTIGERLLYESYKYYNNSLLFNTPRKSNSSNYTLAKYDKETDTYQPFPNKDFNDYNKNIKACQNFISVVSFEIDEDDTIYALDEGSENCNAVLHRIKLEEEGGITSGFFPINVKKENETIILNDLVVDKINNYAYIIYTNISSKNEISYSYGIIGIDLIKNKTTNKIIDIEFDEKYSIPKDLKKKLDNIMPDFDKKSISISLSCDSKALFICPFESRKIYSISTTYIRNDNENISINEAYKNDSTLSIIASNMGNLFFVGIEQKLLYYIAQINNDLSGFDYRSFNTSEIEIEENVTFISKISLANGVLYLTSKYIDENGLKTDIIEKIFEENNTYEKSYMYRCQGLNYNYSWFTYSVWIIFCLIVLFIAVFVIVENKQDLDNYINKKAN